MTQEVIDEVSALRAEVARLQKMVRVLMDRAERTAGLPGSDFQLFQTTITLENQVHQRTAELEEVLHENERVTRELRESENHVRRLAFHDTLTQLANRRLLADRLGQVLVACKRSGHHGALMFMDLDNFKSLNDVHGHDAGDMLLVEVAKRLTSCVREVDTVARMGGDEFVVLLGDLDPDAAVAEAHACSVAEKIRLALAGPYILWTQAQAPVEHRCTASIGVTLFNGQSTQENALKLADQAMYLAKDHGRNQVCSVPSLAQV